MLDIWNIDIGLCFVSPDYELVGVIFPMPIDYHGFPVELVISLPKSPQGITVKILIRWKKIIFRVFSSSKTPQNNCTS